VSPGGQHGWNVEPLFTEGAQSSASLVMELRMDSDKPKSRNWPLIIAIDVAAGLVIALLIWAFGG
jgi:hypothetical protein